MKFALYFSISLFLVTGCSQKSETKNLAYIKLEIVKTEKDFEKLIFEKGFTEGFYFFADSNAVIKRENNKLIAGKESIKNYYSKQRPQNSTVSLSLLDIIVSDSGDMASSYGECTWTSKDSLGKEKISKSIFHTVWKKQEDGSWKYIWN
jgi:ketosteroid isomerase-like protein